MENIENTPLSTGNHLKQLRLGTLSAVKKSCARVIREVHNSTGGTDLARYRTIFYGLNTLISAYKTDFEVRLEKIESQYEELKKINV